MARSAKSEDRGRHAEDGAHAAAAGVEEHCTPSTTAEQANQAPDSSCIFLVPAVHRADLLTAARPHCQQQVKPGWPPGLAQLAAALLLVIHRAVGASLSWNTVAWMPQLQARCCAMARVTHRLQAALLPQKRSCCSASRTCWHVHLHISLATLMLIAAHSAGRASRCRVVGTALHWRPE